MYIKNLNYVEIGNLNSVDAIRDIAIDEDYTINTIRNEGVDNPQRETSIVVGLYDIFHVIDGSYEPSIMDKYDKYIPEIVNMFKEHYGYKFIQLKMFAFTMLESGSNIYQHKDDDYSESDTSYSYCHRIHIPLQTNSDVMFTVGGEDRYLEYGKMIEINNLVEHSVVNKSNEDRIHLIIDFYGINDYYDKTLSMIPSEFYIKKDK